MIGQKGWKPSWQTDAAILAGFLVGCVYGWWYAVADLQAPHAWQ